jgi:extracellular matrix regulatory protein A
MMISIGQKHFIESEYIVEVLGAVNFRRGGTSHTAVENGMLIDATGGRRVKSIIRLKSNHIVLSSLGADTLKSRIKKDIHLPVSGKRAQSSGRRHKKKLLRESKPPELNDRRLGPDRRHFSYTVYFPERRSGGERRNESGRFARDRKN